MPRGVKKKKILIIDPDAFLAGIYARRFEQGGFSVMVNESLKEAEKILREKNLDAILIDLETVPEGLSFLKKIRSKLANDLALIVLTKLGDKTMIDTAMQAGADAYLLKGHFVPSEVVEKVERLVLRAQE